MVIWSIFIAPLIYIKFDFVIFGQVTAVLTVSMSWIADAYFQRDLRQLLMMLLPIHALSMIVFCTTVLTVDRDKSNEGEIKTSIYIYIYIYI